jgi:hypothetical protein
MKNNDNLAFIANILVPAIRLAIASDSGAALC